MAAGATVTAVRSQARGRVCVCVCLIQLSDQANIDCGPMQRTTLGGSFQKNLWGAAEGANLGNK